MSRPARFKNDFFIPLPGEFYNLIEDGTITLNMWCVYMVILRQCDFETGIWRGTMYRVHAQLGGQMHLRTVQNTFKALCDAGYLHSFHVKSERGNYPVLIHRYPVRFGKHKGYRLDADATVNPDAPVYARDTGARPRKDRASTANGPRVQDSHLPYYPDSPSVPDGPNGPERPDAPAVPAVKAKSTEGSDGWLARRVAAILKTKTEKLVIPTSAELHALSDLSEKYGDLAVLLAFYHFADRDRGLDGLDYPISAFLRDAPQYVEDVRQGIQAGEADGYRHTMDAVLEISTLFGGCAGDDQEKLGELVLPLCHLAYMESELQDVFDYDFDCVTDYANAHSSDQLRTELAFFTLAAAHVA